jgi:hypothetical protein
MKIQGFWDTLQKTSGTCTRLLGHTQEEFCDIHQMISKKYPVRLVAPHCKGCGAYTSRLVGHTVRALGHTPADLWDTLQNTCRTYSNNFGVYPEEFWDIQRRNSGTYS